MESRGLDSKVRQNHVLLREEKVHKNTRNHTGKHNKHSEKGTGTTGPLVHTKKADWTT